MRLAECDIQSDDTQAFPTHKDPAYWAQQFDAYPQRFSWIEISAGEFPD